MLELKTFLDYLDNLINDFEIEKRSKKIFDEEAKTFKNKISKINKIVTDIYEQLNDIKNMYNLSEDDLQDLENVNKKLYEINKSYNIIVKDLKTKKDIIICKEKPVFQSFLRSITLQNRMAAAVLTAVARIPGPTTAVGFTLPYWVR